jgi:RNA polymerase sigma factor (TIGR02999 family)
LPTLIYRELRQLARSRMSHLAPGQTLQPTALVNEACLRLLGREDVDWSNRRHFFFAAARAMHDILVDNARRKAAVKHGGAWKREEGKHLSLTVEAPPEEILALEEALSRLEEESPRQHQIVLLRFFAGLDVETTAMVVGVSVRTVMREWRLVRAKLYKQLA